MTDSTHSHSSPSSAGDIDLQLYRWPAEWETHSCTWLAWPRNPNTWPGIFERIPPAYARFVAAVARFEPVRLLVRPVLLDAARRLVDEACAAAAAVHPVEFISLPYNDSWIRDYGPIFLNRVSAESVTDAAAGGDSDNVRELPQQLAIDWDYNAWGGKYPPWEADAAAASQVAELCNVPAIRPGIVLEGGAIEGNGRGTILTTENCLLNPNRNGAVQRSIVEQWLQKFLNASRVVWLPGHGIVGDDTDGHIDQVARFVDDHRVLVAAPFSEDADEAAALRANRAAVEAATNQDGTTLQTLPLPMPSPMYEQGHRLPACYCNYYLCNGGVIVPTFDDAADEHALSLLQSCYPQREVVGVAARELIWGLGAFHCMSQQQPAV